MSPAESRHFILEYAKQLNISQQDTWLVYLTRALAGDALRQRCFVIRYGIEDTRFLNDCVNRTLTSNGVAYGFRPGSRAGPDPHPSIEPLLSAIKDAKSEREVRIIHLVALWELQRSALDLEPTEDTPYLRPEWTINSTDFPWPSRHGLADNWRYLCEREIEAWTSDLQNLHLSTNYKKLKRNIEKLTEDELDQSCTMSTSIPANQISTIMMISADPTDTGRIRSGEQQREIEDALSASRHRDKYSFTSAPSCRIRDITKALDRDKPNILIFNGHGNSQGLAFEDNNGQAVVVPTDKLADLLRGQDGLSLVILNACYSADQAQAMADAVGHVVGLEGTGLVKDITEFSREYFTALGDGRTFEQAFDRARLAIALDQMCTLVPRFLKR